MGEKIDSKAGNIKAMLWSPSSRLHVNFSIEGLRIDIKGEDVYRLRDALQSDGIVEFNSGNANHYVSFTVNAHQEGYSLAGNYQGRRYPALLSDEGLQQVRDLVNTNIEQCSLEQHIASEIEIQKHTQEWMESKRQPKKKGFWEQLFS